MHIAARHVHGIFTRESWFAALALAPRGCLGARMSRIGKSVPRPGSAVDLRRSASCQRMSRSIRLSDNRRPPVWHAGQYVTSCDS